MALLDASRITVLQPVQVSTECYDNESRLVLADGCRVAVHVRQDGEEHVMLRGQWLLEEGFAPYGEAAPVMFLSLQDAEQWVYANVGSEQRF